MSNYNNYFLQDKIISYLKYFGYFIPYIILAWFVYLSTLLLDGEIKEIYLIDKSVTTVHKDDITYSTYHISFYYTNKRDVIYHHKKQPLNIWAFAVN